ncbi:hypothetical protein Taro_054691 [Colocasia esculenta]|uniref:Uncharacterized protein n=1 Tax=Colocasia esculenta TaxID=4460 RepID=A0A843XQS8_COLES|nr:hypothetical protein [Colocasia esculenta]
MLVLWNSIPGLKFHPRACVLVHRLSYPWVGRGYLFARGSEPLARPQFRIDTSTRSSGAQIPLREHDRGLPMRSHTDTPSLKRP